MARQTLIATLGEWPDGWCIDYFNHYDVPVVTEYDDGDISGIGGFYLNISWEERWHNKL